MTGPSAGQACRSQSIVREVSEMLGLNRPGFAEGSGANVGVCLPAFFERKSGLSQAI